MYFKIRDYLSHFLAVFRSLSNLIAVFKFVSAISKHYIFLAYFFDNLPIHSQCFGHRFPYTRWSYACHFSNFCGFVCSLSIRTKCYFFLADLLSSLNKNIVFIILIGSMFLAISYSVFAPSKKFPKISKTPSNVFAFKTFLSS